METAPVQAPVSTDELTEAQPPGHDEAPVSTAKQIPGAVGPSHPSELPGRTDVPMKARRATRRIATPADLLPAVLADGDTATILGSDLRAATTVAKAESVEIGHLSRQLGFTAEQFDRFVDAFTTPNPARYLARWADRETNPGVRRALLAAIVTCEEAR